MQDFASIHSMKNYPWLVASVCKSCPLEKIHTIWWWSPFIPVVQPHLSSMTLPNLRGLNIFSFPLNFSKLWSILGYQRKMKWFYRWLVEILIFNHMYIFIAPKKQYEYATHQRFPQFSCQRWNMDMEEPCFFFFIGMLICCRVGKRTLWINSSASI